ncbi:alpha-ketoglutarate-dependent dioxygenase AlkB [Spongiibacter sp.]|uniref:alpha-ketoglutarate-dependent dioxygenase AlkB family protein n=1 Tax=Spongiibacter sp. TaxID=2024860 RepID=UPI003566DAB5
MAGIAQHGAVDINLLGGQLHYQPEFVSAADTLYRVLRDSVAWQQPVLRIYGRQRPTPRLVSFVGDPGLSYRYSGQCHHSADWPAGVAALRERLANEFQLRFNCALLNYYRDGGDSMAWHSDDETELGTSPAIASISLGERRDFRFRPKPRGAAAGQPAQTIALEHGSLLLMLPPTQANWQHCVPRRVGCGGRINITFRQLIG